MDLETFRREFSNRVASWAEVDANFTAAAFVDVAVDFLAEAGEVADFVPCYYRGVSGRRRLAIDGYAFDSVDRSVRVFVASHGAGESLTQTEATALFGRLRAFLEEAISGGLESRLDDNSPARELADDLRRRAPDLSSIRAYVLSDAVLSSKVRDFPDQAINDIPVEYHIWDISRFYRAFSSLSGRDDLTVAFTGAGLQSIPATSDAERYTGYLCVIRGDQLADIYNQYGSRLLEGNVRSFLSTKGKINRGIRNTILQEPEMFFAYNNGIAATASSVDVVNGTDGMRITAASDLQIVNGGQTTASLAALSKNNSQRLSHIFVPMKLSVISPDGAGTMIPLISRFANSQNKVSEADFFSNHEYHRRLEQLSRRIWAPAKSGAQHETHWFYERARGQYVNESANLRESQRRLFSEENPRSQLLTKTDLAKSELSWQQLPQRVSRGAQSAFLDFATDITSQWASDAVRFNEEYFRQVIARVIVFRALERLVSEQPWYGGYRANIVTYTLARLSYELAKERARILDFQKLWDKQAISFALSEQLVHIAEAIQSVITAPPQGQQNVTQWCKRDDCWERIRHIDIALISSFRAELVDPSVVRDRNRVAREQQQVDSGIDAQAAVVALGFEYWSRVLKWSQANGNVSPADERALKAAAGNYGSLVTERQSRRLLQLKGLFEEHGFASEATVAQIESRIMEVEGFSVRLTYPDGEDLRSDKRGLPIWPYEEAARNAWTVSEWKRERFTPHYSEYDVDILDGNDDPVLGPTKLETVRHSYRDEDEDE